jgi:pimeloyl-ACP methyl ester carboxylesterase
MTDDEVRLYYEEAGSGAAVVFVHEFGGDYRSYEQQMRFFGRRYRCVAYNARGYPPSDVPAELSKYSQDRAREDVLAVLDRLKIQNAHIVGVSMGAFAALHFGLKYPDRTRSLALGGCGYGAEPAGRAKFQEECEAAARRFETLTMAEAAQAYALTPTRVQLQNKDPRAWQEFLTMLAEHSPLGSALTLRGVQKRRPSLYDLSEPIKNSSVPTLIMAGDEDEPCIEASIFLKRTMPLAGLVFLPRTGHAVNLEEPELFNYFCADFFHQVECGRWGPRDPRSLAGRIL